jgi:hypothetical protein
VTEKEPTTNDNNESWGFRILRDYLELAWECSARGGGTPLVDLRWDVIYAKSEGHITATEEEQLLEFIEHHK